MDRANNVIMLSGASWQYSASTLAITTTTYFTNTGEIFDGDMELNNNIVWASDGRAGAFDFESTLLHEAGHFLGLQHTASSYIAVMYASLPTGTVKRVLQPPDTADVCDVYPAGPGGQGWACLAATECTAGRVCEGRAGSSQKMCTENCAKTSDPCPDGYTCQASTAGYACLPQRGAPDQCKFCTGPQDCSAGVCLRTNGTGMLFCSKGCTDSAQCPEGNSCTSTPSGSYCVPETACTTQCTDAPGCAVGFTCTGGTCLPTGNVGDRCEVSGWCKACATCVVDASDASLAFCRACCAGGSANGLCNGCTNTQCSPTDACTALTNGLDSVCIAKAAAPGVCQACSGTTCADGLKCVSGRCHSACNPASPGQCAACFGLNDGTGVCACFDEVAKVGEPCGNIAGGGIAACSTGAACVGSPQTLCRATCSETNPASCKSDEACQKTNGVLVCLPGTAGSRCAPCLSDNTCNSGLTCHLGRCYEPCNINVGDTCDSCVVTDAPIGVCACRDQLAAVNEACGTQPTVRGCPLNTRCLAGSCRSQCDPQAPFNCPGGSECQPYAGLFFCQDAQPQGGGPGGGGGGMTASGGGKGGGGQPTSNHQGCGCSATPVSAAFALSLLGLWFRRVKRRRD
jgi:hypothetical protein